MKENQRKESLKVESEKLKKLFGEELSMSLPIYFRQ